MSQLSLRYDARWLTGTQWDELLEVIVQVANEIGLKQMAYDLDVPPSSISNAIAKRDRHAFHGHWLLYLAVNDPSKRLVEKLCDLCSGYFMPREELTDAEKVRRYEAAAAKLPENLRAAFLRDAGL